MWCPPPVLYAGRFLLAGALLESEGSIEYVAHYLPSISTPSDRGYHMHYLIDSEYPPVRPIPPLLCERESLPPPYPPQTVNLRSYPPHRRKPRCSTRFTERRVGDVRELDGSKRFGPLCTYPHVEILSKFEVLGPRNTQRLWPDLVKTALKVKL